jgi:hypothetical protein
MDSSSDAYVGIDLAIAKGKSLPVVFCTWDGDRCVPLPIRDLGIKPPRGHGNAAVLDRDLISEFVSEAADFLAAVASGFGVSIRRIAIDAPRAPAAAIGQRRLAEAALDQRGISCFTTPSEEQWRDILQKVRQHLMAGGPHARIPHANQLWMLVGFELFDRLSGVAECLEVYPQLTVQLLGAGAQHKTKQGAVQAQLEAAARHTGWPIGAPGEPALDQIGFGSSHDQLDAYLAAWVAALPENRRIALGEPPDDAIWAPQIAGEQFSVKPSQIPMKASQKPLARLGHPSTPVYEGDHSLECPACQSYRFKRWPFGWDAHAAHKCPGVKGDTPQERKADFRARFADLFK